MKTLNLAERLLEIGRSCAAQLKPRFRTVNHGEMLYDKHGLPAAEVLDENGGGPGVRLRKRQRPKTSK